MRLGTGQRIGIVISVAWVIGAAVYQRYADFQASTLLMNGAFEICDYVNYRLGDYRSCWHDLMRIAAFLQGSWANPALIPLAPVALGWLVLYGPLTLWRWMRAGAWRAT